ncbi:MAG: amino acid-binding protein [Lachnospiraceae bacterium]|nr:amino acid-binding protein [Lachnospiraceae bacterium]
MVVKQLTVFIENREGRMCDVLEILKNNDINILAASIADSSDFGLIRMIVSEPQKAYEALKNKGVMAKITEIISVIVPNETGGLENILKVMSENGINIKYMYGISSKQNEAAIAMKTEKQDEAVALLKSLELKGFCEE